MKKSEDGVNVIRCVALLMVFGFHYYLYNGYANQPQQGVWMLFANVQRILFISCNGLFMMLTGYLKSDKPINRHYFKCILTAVVTYIIVSAISIPVRHFFLNESKSFYEWKQLFFEFGGAYYGWYIAMYIGLILISPILNTCVKHTEDNKLLILMTGLLIAATSLSSLTEYSVFPDYWKIAYPMSYYMLGAVIKKLKPIVKTKWTILITALIAFTTGLATLLSTDYTIANATKYEFGSICIIFIVVCIFLMLYRIKLPKSLSKLAEFISRGTLPAYLLSNLTDAWIYKMVPAFHKPQLYFVGFILITVPTYIAWVTIGNGVSFVIGKMTVRDKKKRMVE